MKHIVGFSGGIDSQACARWVLNRFPAEDVILMNSGAGRNESPLTVAFVDEYSRAVHPVIVVTPIVADVWKTDGFAERRGLDGGDELTFEGLIAIKGCAPTDRRGRELGSDAAVSAEGAAMKNTKKTMRAGVPKLMPPARATAPAHKPGRKAVQAAKQTLRAAIWMAAMARGEAQFTNGYRCGKQDESSELYAKEMRQWEVVGEKEGEMQRAIDALVKAVRAEGRR